MILVLRGRLTVLDITALLGSDYGFQLRLDGLLCFTGVQEELGNEGNGKRQSGVVVMLQLGS